METHGFSYSLLPFFVSGTDYEGKTVQWTTGKTQCWNILAVKQHVLQHQTFRQVLLSPSVSLSPAACTVPLLVGQAGAGEAVSWYPPVLSSVHPLMSCLTYTRSLLPRLLWLSWLYSEEMVAAEAQEEREHVSAINFTKKAAACLEMFRLMFQGTYLTLPLYSSGILMPASSSNMILEVIFHAGYNTEKNVVDFSELIMVVYQKLFSWLKTI